MRCRGLGSGATAFGMSSTRLKFGRAVRRLRTRAGYSQESFADEVGVHRTFMGSVERGETNISLDNIVRIAKGLRVTLPDLFAEVERDGR
jgi:transcriptional regulator with XRE-family HTH domain